MGTVKFVIEAEAAKLLQEALKVVTAQKKMESGFEGMANAGRKATRDAEASVERLRQKMQRSAQEQSAQMSRVTVGSVWNKTRGGQDLRMLQAEREVLKHGQYGMFYDQAVALRDLRKIEASKVRAQRTEERAMRQRLIDQDVKVYMAKASDASYRSMMSKYNSKLRASQDRAVEREGAIRQRHDDDASRAANLEADLALIGLQRADQAKSALRDKARAVFDGVVAAGTAAGAYLTAYDAELRNYSTAMVSFNDKIRPLMGVGDNHKRRSKLIQEVFQDSAALGIDPGQASQSRFDLQSRASDRTQEEFGTLISEAQKFYKLQGSDIGSTASALDSAARLLKDELPQGKSGIRTVSNRLAYAADVGAFEVNEIAPYLAEIVGSMKLMGFRGNDALSAAVVASQSGMRPEKWATAVRNVSLVMPDAEAKLGLRLRGMPFSQSMAALQNVSPDKLVDAFGRDSAAVVKMLSDNSVAIQKNVSALDRVTGAIDILGEKLFQIYGNPTAISGNVVASSMQIEANASAIQLQDPRLAKDLEAYAMRRAGAKLNYGPAQKAIFADEVSAWVEQVISDDSRPGGPGGMNLITGVKANIAARRQRAFDQKGNVIDPQSAFEADYLELAYNPDKNISWTNAKGQTHKVMPEDAEEYRSMVVEQGYAGLTGHEYVSWRQKLARGDVKGAEEYLKKNGGQVPLENRDGSGSNSQNFGQMVSLLGSIDGTLKTMARNPNQPIRNPQR